MGFRLRNTGLRRQQTRRKPSRETRLHTALYQDGPRGLALDLRRRPRRPPRRLPLPRVFRFRDPERRPHAASPSSSPRRPLRPVLSNDATATRLAQAKNVKGPGLYHHGRPCPRLGHDLVTPRRPARLHGVGRQAVPQTRHSRPRTRRPRPRVDRHSARRPDGVVWQGHTDDAENGPCVRRRTRPRLKALGYSCLDIGTPDTHRR